MGRDKTIAHFLLVAACTVLGLGLEASTAAADDAVGASGSALAPLPAPPEMDLALGAEDAPAGAGPPRSAAEASAPATGDPPPEGALAEAPAAGAASGEDLGLDDDALAALGPGGGEGDMAAAPELMLWQDVPTVVSASRREEPVSRAPNAVTVITADQIHASGLMTLGSLLRLAVGVEAGRIHGNAQAISVRGLQDEYAKHTLVLMDGRTIYNPFWGGVQWFQVPVLVEDIERIEVVRGPGGAAWGANAANGVINIITKKPGDTPGFFLSQTVTSRLDSLTHLRYGLSTEKLDLRFSAGYDSMPEVGVREGDAIGGFSRLVRANVRSTYHFDERRTLDFDGGYLDGIRGATPHPPELFGDALEDAHYYPQNWFVRTRYTNRQSPDDLWYVQYFYNSTRTTVAETGPFFFAQQHDVEAQRTLPLGEDHLLTFGGNLRLDILTNGDPWVSGESHTARFDNERSYNRQAGLFVQNRWTPHEHCTFILGGRADRNSYTGWEWSGRGTALYHPVPEHTFRASVARAFRTPSLIDRALDTRAGFTGLAPPFDYVVRQMGSTDLNASYVKAYEFGYTYHRDNLKLNAEFFWNRYRGLMRLATTSLESPFAGIPFLPAELQALEFQTQQFRNEVDGDLYGIELSGKWQATERLRLDGWYVWEQYVQRHPSGGRLSHVLAHPPPQQKVSLGARYEPVDSLFLNGRMWWVDELEFTAARSVDPYARFDFNVAKQFGERAEIAIGVQNAFDERHPEVQDTFGTLREVGERTFFIRFQTKF